VRYMQNNKFSEGSDPVSKIILAAISFDRLQEALSLAKKQPFIAFGGMDGDVLGPLGEVRPDNGAVPDIRVYFYNYD